MTFWTDGPRKPAAPLFLEDYSSGTGASAAFAEGWANSPLPSLADIETLDQARRGAPTFAFRAPGPRRAPDSELMSSAEANRWFGIPGELSFDQPVRAREALLRHDWKTEEIRRRDVLNRAERGLLPGAARLGAGFLAQALDPINVASAFIPVVGEARYLRMLQLAGSAGGRALVRAGVGAAEGAVGAALVEPLVYQGARARGQDYDLWDSLENIGFGAALGGGLHAAGGAVSDVLRGRAEKRASAGEELVREIGIDQHAAATQGAIAALAEDRPVRVAEALRRFATGDVDPTARVIHADPADLGGSIAAFVDRVRDRQDHGFLQLGEVAPGTVAAARAAGVELGGFRHVMQGDDVRHVLERHAAAAPDEVPVTPADLAKVPEIVANPDRVIATETRQGVKALQFTKRMGDTHIVIEEVRGRKKRLAFKTMFIRKAGGPEGPGGGALRGGDGGGSGSPGTSDAPRAEPRTVRPDREPGTAGETVGAPAPESNVAAITAPDPDTQAAIARIEADTAPELGQPATTEEQIAQIEAELGELEARLPAALEALITKVPNRTEPKSRSLYSYIKAFGGVKDEGGDLKAMNADRRIGLINNKKGRSLDKLGEAMLQDGFDVRSEANPHTWDVNKVKELIRRELAGEKVYALGEEVTAAEDRLIQEAGYAADRERQIALTANRMARSLLDRDLDAPELQTVFRRFLAEGYDNVEDAVLDTLEGAIIRDVLATERAMAGENYVDDVPFEIDYARTGDAEGAGAGGQPGAGAAASEADAAGGAAAGQDRLSAEGAGPVDPPEGLDEADRFELQQADEIIATATREARAFEVAAACFSGGGA